MYVYDLIMLAVIVAATAFGAHKGLIWQLASISSIVVSYFVALQYREQLAVMINAEPPWNTALAMLIIYAVTSLVIWIVFQMVRDVIDRFRLREFDHQMGALVGAAKGALLCVIITIFGVALLSQEQRSAICHSFSGQQIAKLVHRAAPVIPQDIRTVLDPYLEEHPPGPHEHHDLAPAPGREPSGPQPPDPFQPLPGPGTPEVPPSDPWRLPNLGDSRSFEGEDAVERR